MRWYDVKKHEPVLTCCLALVRLKHIEDKNTYYVLAEYDNGWKDWELKCNLEDDDYFVTHFCIPDPIEI